MPAQRHASGSGDPNYFLVKLDERDAKEYVVRDIQTGDRLNWTFEHPEMKFPVEPRPGLRFWMHFWIHERTIRDTGPVTLVVKLDGHLLGTVRCEHEGSYVFEQPVRLEWLSSGEPAHILAEASPLWIAPEDGAKLGYLIEEAGFRW